MGEGVDCSCAYGHAEVVRMVSWFVTLVARQGDIACELDSSSALPLAWTHSTATQSVTATNQARFRSTDLFFSPWSDRIPRPCLRLARCYHLLRRRRSTTCCRSRPRPRPGTHLHRDIIHRTSRTVGRPSCPRGGHQCTQSEGPACLQVRRSLSDCSPARGELHSVSPSRAREMIASEQTRR
jgi:hypothetical protein